MSAEYLKQVKTLPEHSEPATRYVPKLGYWLTFNRLQKVLIKRKQLYVASNTRNSTRSLLIRTHIVRVMTTRRTWTWSAACRNNQNVISIKAIKLWETTTTRRTAPPNPWYNPLLPDLKVVEDTDTFKLPRHKLITWLVHLYRASST